MSLRIRLQRCGCKNNPCYHVVVAESSKRRDGPFVELLGFYDPKKPESKKSNLNLPRMDYWMSVGARPTDTVKHLEKLARQYSNVQQNV